jgi:hypothetical protein
VKTSNLTRDTVTGRMRCRTTETEEGSRKTIHPPMMAPGLTVYTFSPFSKNKKSPRLRLALTPVFCDTTQTE